MIALVIATVSQAPGEAVRVTMALRTNPLQRGTLVWDASVPRAFVDALHEERRLKTAILVPDAFFTLEAGDQRQHFGRALHRAIARQLTDRPLPLRTESSTAVAAVRSISNLHPPTTLGFGQYWATIPQSTPRPAAPTPSHRGERRNETGTIA